MDKCHHGWKKSVRKQINEKERIRKEEINKRSGNMEENSRGREMGEFWNGKQEQEFHNNNFDIGTIIKNYNELPSNQLLEVRLKFKV